MKRRRPTSGTVTVEQPRRRPEIEDRWFGRPRTAYLDADGTSRIDRLPTADEQVPGGRRGGAE